MKRKSDKVSRIGYETAIAALRQTKAELQVVIEQRDRAFDERDTANNDRTAAIANAQKAIEALRAEMASAEFARSRSDHAARAAKTLASVLLEALNVACNQPGETS